MVHFDLHKWNAAVIPLPRSHTCGRRQHPPASSCSTEAAAAASSSDDRLSARPGSPAVGAGAAATAGSASPLPVARRLLIQELKLFGRPAGFAGSASAAIDGATAGATSGARAGNVSEASRAAAWPPAGGMATSGSENAFCAGSAGGSGLACREVGAGEGDGVGRGRRAGGLGLRLGPPGDAEASRACTCAARETNSRNSSQQTFSNACIWRVMQQGRKAHWAPASDEPPKMWMNTRRPVNTGSVELPAGKPHNLAHNCVA